MVREEKNPGPWETRWGRRAERNTEWVVPREASERESWKKRRSLLFWALLFPLRDRQHRRINYRYAKLRLWFNFVLYPNRNRVEPISFALFLFLYPSTYLSLSPRYPIIECRSHVKEKRDPIIYFLPSPSARCRRRGSVPFCVKLRWISRNKPKSRMEV